MPASHQFLRLAPYAAPATPSCVSASGDGSYTLAISGRGRVDPTPQLVRYAAKFVPMFAKRWRKRVD